MMYLFLANIILGVIGFYIAYYVYSHKTKQAPMTCSIEHDCNNVVSSKFGKTLGIENTVLGMLYYVFITIGYLVVLLNDFLILGYSLSFWVLLISIFAALFSWYLIGVMAFKLKEWCDWCIGSAVVSNLIGVIGLIGYLVF